MHKITKFPLERELHGEFGSNLRYGKKISLEPRCLNSRVKDLFDLTGQNDPGHRWILARSIPRSAATWRPQLMELLEWYFLEMPVVSLGTMSLSLDFP